MKLDCWSHQQLMSTEAAAKSKLPGTPETVAGNKWTFLFWNIHFWWNAPRLSFVPTIKTSILSSNFFSN